MTTMKSIISNGISTALTSIYTNSTGEDAALKAFNVNLPGTSVSTSTGGSDWTFFGDYQPWGDYAALRQSQPQTVRLASNRLLFLWTEHWNTMTSSGGTADVNNAQLYTQIVEYQTNKYVCGPIVPVRVSDTLNNIFSSTSRPLRSGLGTGGTSLVKGVALTSTKVALLLSGTAAGGSDNYLVNLNIVDNRVSQIVYGVKVNGVIHSGCAGIEIVPGNTNKVIIGGRSAATGNTYGMGVYEVTGSANPTLLGSSFNTGVAFYSNANTQSALSLHRRSDPTYIFATYNASAVDIVAGIVTFNDATNTFTLVSSNTLTAPAGTQDYQYPIQIGCASNGTDYSSCILTGTATFTAAWIQSSGTTINTTGTSANAGTAFNGLSYAYDKYNWGNQRVIFTLPYMNYLSFTGNGTGGGSLAFFLQNPSNNTGFPTAWFANFDSKPLYVIQDGTSSTHPVYLTSRINPSSGTNYGTVSSAGCYLPFGQPTGKHYQWNEAAQCWIVVLGSSWYALDRTGAILNERLDFPSATYSIKAISILPDGTLYAGGDTYGYSSATSSNQSIGSAQNNQQVALYYSSAGALATASSLSSFTWTDVVIGGSNQIVDVVAWVDASGNRNAMALYSATSSTTMYLYAAYGSSFGTTNINTNLSTGLTSNPGYGYSIGAWVWTSPPSSTNPNGLGIYVGQAVVTANSSSLIRSTTPISPLNPTNFNTSATINSAGPGSSAPYRVIVSRSNSNNGFDIVAQGDPDSNVTYAFISNNKTIINGLAGSAITGTELGLATAAATKSIATLATNNAYGVAWGSSPTNPPKAYVYTASTTVPAATYTGSVSGASASPFITNDVVGPYTNELFGSGLSLLLSSNGTNPINFKLTISSATSDFYVTGLQGASLTNSSNRSNDVYYVPNGYSVKVSADVAGVADVMLSVLEQ